jgi:hypothetical protein
MSKKDDDAEILVSTSGFSSIAGAPASHSTIYFTIGNTVYALGGFPFEAATGARISATATGDFRIKAVVSGYQNEASSKADGSPDATGEAPSGQGSKDQSGFTNPQNHVIFRGSKADVMERLAKALEAAEYINMKDMEYASIGVIVPGQNCNSVTNSLVSAMGLKHGLPDTPWLGVAARVVGLTEESADTRIADGKDRNLMPTDWRSRFDGLADRIRLNGGQLPPEDAQAFKRLLVGNRQEAISQQMVEYNQACKDSRKLADLLGPDSERVDLSALCTRNNGFVVPAPQASLPADRLNQVIQARVTDEGLSEIAARTEHKQANTPQKPGQ